MWTVPGSSSGGFTITQGINSNGYEASLSFAFSAFNTALKPGMYTIKVMGYIPRGPSVTKNLTVNVTQDTATQFFIPFQIQPMGTTLTNVTASATIISSNGS